MGGPGHVGVGYPLTSGVDIKGPPPPRVPVAVPPAAMGPRVLPLILLLLHAAPAPAQM